MASMHHVEAFNSSTGSSTSSSGNIAYNSKLPTPNHRTVLTIGNYRLGRTLGVGSFGKVKVAEHIYTSNKVAIKILNRRKIKNLRMDEKIRREIQNLKLFRHPHIIKLYEVIEAPTDIFMVMEYVPGGELFDYIVQNGKLSEDEGRRLFQQIISGVEYCHSHKVVHRDLKPENLLLDTIHMSVKIADFGLSNMMQDGDFLKTSCGSPNYAAPEVISGRLYAGPEVDVWSCGVILYALLCAKLPFDDEYIPSLFKKIREGIFTVPEHISASCADLIRQMLVVDPLKRITIAEIRKHQWFATKLPKYLAYSPSCSDNRAIQEPDEEIVTELLVKYADPSISREKLLEELRSDASDFIVAYHLLYDAKRNPYYSYENKEEASVDQVIETEVQNLREGIINFQLDEEDELELGSVPSSPNVSTTNLNSLTSPSKEKKRWILGIPSLKNPIDIMTEVFRALVVCGFEWKVSGPYQLRCLSKVGTRGVKITLQLFKVTENRFLLDIKKIDAETFLFFDTCSRLRSELHI
eukprot:Phypoly_transcript_04125.p1 GENE.Phypoly_transcript_04125~~Phypoly_transcript_04125.p1  ORF type:complete len:523 (+),score=67.31 Phypoly_transcript_04125:600-2168(+)